MSRNDFLSREQPREGLSSVARVPSRFSQLIRGEPLNGRIGPSQPEHASVGSAMLDVREIDREALGRDLDATEREIKNLEAKLVAVDAHEQARGKAEGRFKGRRVSASDVATLRNEAQDRLTKLHETRGRLASELGEQDITLPETAVEQTKRPGIVFDSTDEQKEWAGEQDASVETIPEQQLPVLGIVEGLQARPLEGLDSRPIIAHINQPVRSGDFLEFRYAGALRLRLKVVDRVGNLPDTTLYATLLTESPDENQFADEVMRLQRAAPSRTARLAMKKRPRVWQMDVDSDGNTSLAVLRDQQEVIQEAKELQRQAEEHKKQLAEYEGGTEALTTNLFVKVPAARS